MSKPLPVLRPLLLVAALPFTVLACLRALGPAQAPRAAQAPEPLPPTGPHLQAPRSAVFTPDGAPAFASCEEGAGFSVIAADGPSNEVVVLDR